MVTHGRRRTHAGCVLRTPVDAWRGERPLVAHHRRVRRMMLRRVLRAVDAASREGPRTSPGRRCAMVEATAHDFAPVVRRVCAVVAGRCARHGRTKQSSMGAGCARCRRDFSLVAAPPPAGRRSGDAPAMS
ncbi:hypothetical protein F511_47312 [Dorcoceras hygrometricum]|uniref:Uncharacterized protein n=1 Tax=Dorcoceras hygrometricum TaxID=472368 RepID=A0A2Z6ZXV2_9LAMI|nr:hypothetical protein F511_47312 [Dorcoceras hygrometricum]